MRLSCRTGIPAGERLNQGVPGNLSVGGARSRTTNRYKIYAAVIGLLILMTTKAPPASMSITKTRTPHPERVGTAEGVILACTPVMVKTVVFAGSPVR